MEIETKSVISLQVMMEEHLCEFNMPVGISFGQAIDASHQIFKKLIELAKDAADQSQPIKKD